MMRRLLQRLVAIAAALVGALAGLICAAAMCAFAPLFVGYVLARLLFGLPAIIWNSATGKGAPK